MTDESVLRFGTQDNFVEISAVVERDPSLQSHGDVRLSIGVQSYGFNGCNALWVDRHVLRMFAGQLAKLERSLAGEAKLNSMSPGELELTVRSVSPLGHIAVMGSTAHRFKADSGSYLHSVSFGFEIESAQLLAALGNSWLSEYVKP